MCLQLIRLVWRCICLENGCLVVLLVIVMVEKEEEKETGEVEVEDLWMLFIRWCSCRQSGFFLLRIWLSEQNYGNRLLLCYLLVEYFGY